MHSLFTKIMLKEPKYKEKGCGWDILASLS